MARNRRSGSAAEAAPGAGRRRRRASGRVGPSWVTRSPSSRRRISPDCLIQAIQPLAEAGPEVEPERLVLALEPAGAEAEDGATSSAGRASSPAWPSGPGCGTCWPRPGAPAGPARQLRPGGQGQPASSFAAVQSPSSASRWSSAQRRVEAGRLGPPCDVARAGHVVRLTQKAAPNLIVSSISVRTRSAPARMADPTAATTR